uniref:Uncharacterized protein n=1 Tax=Knipowitschia caucasica TaxID=637954 RepID=A0AAV2K6U5_KNICA
MDVTSPLLRRRVYWFIQDYRELGLEQQADVSLKNLFEQVRPTGEAVDSACGYFLQESLLVSVCTSCWTEEWTGTEELEDALVAVLSFGASLQGSFGGTCILRAGV